MTKTLEWILIGFLFFNFSSIASAKETIRIANGEWPPYLSEDLKHFGFASRIVAEAFALEGVEVKYGFFPWGRAYAVVQKGKWDGSVLWTIKEERKKDVYFSDPVVTSWGVFLHLKSFKFKWNPEEINFNELKGKTIGTLIGAKHGVEFDNAEKTGLIYVERVSKDVQNIKKLLSGRIDIAMSDLNVGYDILNKQFRPEEIQLITHTRWRNVEDNYHLILSKKVEENRPLLKLFNRGLKKLKDIGKYDQYLKESQRGDYNIQK